MEMIMFVHVGGRGGLSNVHVSHFSLVTTFFKIKEKVKDTFCVQFLKNGFFKVKGV